MDKCACMLILMKSICNILLIATCSSIIGYSQEHRGSIWGMHVSHHSHVKHSYAWLPRKCDYRTDRRTDGRTYRCLTKWSLMCCYASQMWGYCDGNPAVVGRVTVPVLHVTINTRSYVKIHQVALEDLKTRKRLRWMYRYMDGQTEHNIIWQYINIMRSSTKHLVTGPWCWFQEDGTDLERLARDGDARRGLVGGLCPTQVQRQK